MLLRRCAACLCKWAAFSERPVNSHALTDLASLAYGSPWPRLDICLQLLRLPQNYSLHVRFQLCRARQTHEAHTRPR